MAIYLHCDDMSVFDWFIYCGFTEEDALSCIINFSFNRLQNIPDEQYMIYCDYLRCFSHRVEITLEGDGDYTVHRVGY